LRLTTNLAKKVHAINHGIMAARIARPGKIDAAPVDCRAISILGCFVAVEGVCVTAVAIKRLP
jgi:hypothetical protein